MEIWEPQPIPIGQRVVVRLRGECPNFAKGFSPESGKYGHHFAEDGRTGVVVWRTGPDDPVTKTGHIYCVVFDEPFAWRGDIDLNCWGKVYAPTEIDPIPMNKSLDDPGYQDFIDRLAHRFSLDTWRITTGGLAPHALPEKF